MKKNSLLLNKYTLTVFILLAYFAVDALLHKGMCRVLMGASFTDQRKPFHITRCSNQLQVTGKIWTKAVNTAARLNKLPADAPGFEMDVYFDTLKNTLLLYHDSTEYSTLPIEAVLDMYSKRKMNASIWLDFKNLAPANEVLAVRYLAALRSKFGLKEKIIIESSNPQCLQSFCDSGFFTSYYTAFFNPYQQSEEANILFIDSIAAILKKYPVSAVSGYYFQYPLLKKYFPGFPVLTWADDPGWSVMGYFFNRKLAADEHLNVILHPLK